MRLHEAFQKGDEKTVHRLLKDGADVNAKGWYDETPLFCAAGWGHEKVVELLLKNGADIKAGNFYGTALHAAAENGHAEVVRLLLQEGADINIEDEERETALDREVTVRNLYHPELNCFLTHRHSALPRTDSIATADIWHQRFGHCGPRVLEEIGNALTNVKLKGPSTCECEVCAVSKMHKIISRRPRVRAIKPFEKVHWDLIYHDEEGWNKEWYTSHFQDDCTVGCADRHGTWHAGGSLRLG
jgi:hypothetical protein